MSILGNLIKVENDAMVVMKSKRDARNTYMLVGYIIVGRAHLSVPIK